MMLSCYLSHGSTCALNHETLHMLVHLVLECLYQHFTHYTWTKYNILCCHDREMDAEGHLMLEGCIEMAWMMGYKKHFDGIFHVLCPVCFIPILVLFLVSGLFIVHITWRPCHLMVHVTCVVTCDHMAFIIRLAMWSVLYYYPLMTAAMVWLLWELPYLLWLPWWEITYLWLVEQPYWSFCTIIRCHPYDALMGSVMIVTIVTKAVRLLFQ